MRQQVFDYMKTKYGALPEHPWRRFETYAVFRHEDNSKWFALVMNVDRERAGLPGAGYADVINLKVDDPFFREALFAEPGIVPAYHMSRMHWITVLLDGTVPEATVFDLIDASFMATASAKKKEKLRPPKEWIIPANPEYYDIIHAFDDTDLIEWKQGAGIRTGDTVYMYVGAPVSAVMYRCRVLKTDIPYRRKHKYITIKALMEIRLEKRFDPEEFTFQVLKDEYGVRAVRGPRGIPHSLSCALEEAHGQE